MVTEKNVMEKWEEIKNDEEQILFIVGAPGSGKSAILRGLGERENWQYIEAKELLNEAILEVPREMRPEKAEELLMLEINRKDAEVVIIDSIDILFAPILNLEPVEMLKKISQEHPLVIGWKGQLNEDVLYLEHNNNPRYYEHPVKNVNHVIVVD